MTQNHYVYCSYEEWGREYVGRRTCDCLPEEDTKYFGSFRDKTFKPKGKDILFVCETREEAAEIEIKLHDFFDVAVNPQFVNRAKAVSTGFDTTGVPRTKESKKKQSEAVSGEKHRQYGVPITEETKKKLSEANSGRTLTEEHKKKISEATSGEKNCNHGKFGALNHSSKAIIAIEPDGTQRHYGGGREAARELVMNPSRLSKYARSGHVLTQGKFKGWKFVFENP